MDNGKKIDIHKYHTMYINLEKKVNKTKNKLYKKFNERYNMIYNICSINILFFIAKIHRI